jgi:hypothetical protein
MCHWPQVLPHPQLISPSKIQFFGIFSHRNHYSLLHSESKSYQINFLKACSSRSFQQHQRHIPIPLKFSAKKSFNIQEHLQPKSKRHGTKPMHLSSSRAFQRHQHDLKHLNSVDLISTNETKQNKTNYLPS